MTVNPKSLLNLRSFKKGENGNHEGYSLKSAIKAALDKPLTKPLDSAPARDHVVYATLAGAIDREATPFKELWDRLEGKMAQPEAHSGHVVLEVRYDRNELSGPGPGVAERVDGD